MTYVPDSISERFIATYAREGKTDVDAEQEELLAICVLESHRAAELKSGEEAAYFRESTEILEAIQAEIQG
jgi:hypothetical protein